ncbi:MAG TPA: PH domain-containing protein [Intrasporangium sp.]|uniref:PH domain-containing protein n=1 Tax=Intrasporangium sp. TaxID=1925024 RepID=UPI002D7863E8|nr:PH domain-containing protein [Intrasporangium sp.]HET7397558.1 PH domain-containing protein [Intrasporangium sp.]
MPEHPVPPDQPSRPRDERGTEAAFAAFRPRRGRAVALGCQWGALLLFAVLALALPGVAGGARWGVADRLMFFAIGVVIALLAHRYASIVAVPSREGLVVRNLVVTRTITWPEIVGVQFGGGEPWVSLDLADADTVAVMAIQKADGPVAVREASRLAALVQALGERSPGTSPGPTGPDADRGPDPHAGPGAGPGAGSDDRPDSGREADA